MYTGIHTDHSFVDILIHSGDIKQRGKGFWKMNTSLLKDKIYVHKVKDTIKETLENNSQLGDKGCLWDFIKCKIRGVTISYSSYIAKERRKHEDELYTKLETYESTILDDNTYEVYTSLKQEYEQIQNEKARGVLIRSRAKFIEDGERNTKFFLNLEKKNHDIRHIQCIKDANDKLITDPQEILDEQRKYYENLYSDPNIDIDCKCNNSYNFMENPNISKLCTQSSKECEENITVEEFTHALRAMQNNKSPGSDGFPTEFYTFFWNDMKCSI